MPFTTWLIGEYSDTEAATILFAANVALASLAGQLSEWEATRAGLLRADSPINDRPFVSWALFTPILFALSIPLALISTTAAQYSWLLTAARACATGRFGPRRLDQPRTPSSQSKIR